MRVELDIHVSVPLHAHRDHGVEATSGESILTPETGAAIGRALWWDHTDAHYNHVTREDMISAYD